MAEEKKSRAKPEPAFVTKQEFDAFGNRMLELLENVVAAKTPDAPVVAPQYSPANPHPSAVSTDPKNGVLPAQYQTMFEKYFDPTDGFEARLTFPEILENGQESGGINFTIVVPMKFSNTDDGYRKMHKVDLRTRALMPSNIVKGMEDWCARVAKNLNYNKLTKTK